MPVVGGTDRDIELLGSAIDHVAFAQIGRDEADILDGVAAHRQAVAVDRIVDYLPRAAPDRRMLDQHCIADIACLALHHHFGTNRALV